MWRQPHLVVGARIPLVLVENRIIVCEELVPNLFASVHQRVELLAAGTSGTFALSFLFFVVFHSVFAPQEVLLLWCVCHARASGWDGAGGAWGFLFPPFRRGDRDLLRTSLCK